MTSLVQTSLSSNLKHDKRPDYSTPPRSIPRLAGLWQAMRRHYPPSTSAISTSKSTITCAGFPLKNCRRILTKTTCDKTFTLRLLNRCPTSIRIYRRKILFKTGWFKSAFAKNSPVFAGEKTWANARWTTARLICQRKLPFARFFGTGIRSVPDGSAKRHRRPAGRPANDLRNAPVLPAARNCKQIENIERLCAEAHSENSHDISCRGHDAGLFWRKFRRPMDFVNQTSRGDNGSPGATGRKVWTFFNFFDQ